MTDPIFTTAADPQDAGAADVPIVSARGLSLFVRDGRRRIRIVSDVTFDIAPGEFFALVGESGSGKTMIARALMRLMPPRLLEIEGELSYRGESIPDLSEARMRSLRGGAISMVFQEPMTSLDPLMPIGRQIEETLEIHSDLGRKARLDRIHELLAEVRFPDPTHVAQLYPHEMSGGMRQRAMIAMALANEPTLLIADEPTTALDVTIQREVMEIMQRLQARHRLSVLFISHDLSLVNQYAERVGVLYGGVLMEVGPKDRVIGSAAHPYTQALLDCVPRRRTDDTRRSGIGGSVPSPLNWSAGCRFRNRCPRANAACAGRDIALETFAPSHHVRCIRPGP